MKTEVIRKSTSFRLREDVVEILKRKASLANRTLNNYVESLLIADAYGDEPNSVTKAAIAEAMANRGKHVTTYDSVDSLMNALDAE